MKAKPVIPRQSVSRDIDEALAYYLDEGATGAALGLIDAVEHAFTHISRQPGSGSPRYAHELNLPGLTTWLLTPYPHLVFYLERPDHIDVWRVVALAWFALLIHNATTYAKPSRFFLLEEFRKQGGAEY